MKKREVKPFRAVVACGGTGGHLFPGLAVAEVLKERGHEVLLIVSEKPIDSIALEGYPEFRSEKVPSIGMPPVISPAFLKFMQRCWESLGLCRGIYRRFRPSVILGMGGFTSIAPLVAGRLRRLPTLIHESNAIPGRANRLAAKFCTRVLLGFDQARERLPGKDCAVTGTPVRSNLRKTLPRAEALSRLGLEPDRPVVFVMGGSQGASGINRIMIQAVPRLKDLRFQVIHLAGERDERLAAANYQREEIPHFVAAFHHAMEELYPAADLVISRAGASSLSELAYFGLPSVLVPYPYAADDHQTANARIFEEGGASIVQTESAATPESFAELLAGLVPDSGRRESMAEAARALSPVNAADNVADQVERMVEVFRRKGAA